MSDEIRQIVQVSRREMDGGIARIADYLHRAYKRRGLKSLRAVSHKNSQDPDVWQIPDRKEGMEQLLALPSDTIIHLHSPDSFHFGLAGLPELSCKYPVIVHLHDAWLLSGGCSHSVGCDKWLSGCVECGHTKSEAWTPKQVADSWQYKRAIYSQSHLYVVAPCQWLMNKARASMLAPAIIEGHVIAHGVDFDQFCPGDKGRARAELGLPPEVLIVLFVNSGAWRDYELVQRTMEGLRSLSSDVWILGVGSGLRLSEPHKNILLLDELPPESMPACYQAADVYVHPARADTFPNVVLEALTCGLPVVATDVGGVNEQVWEGITGFLFAPERNSDWLTVGTALILRRPKLRHYLSRMAAEDAWRRFDLQRMATAFLQLYDRAGFSK